MSLRGNLTPSHSSPIRWGKAKSSAGCPLAMNPRVYLLDEPFASIDRKSRIEILEILKELALDGRQLFCATMIYLTIKPISTIWLS